MLVLPARRLNMPKACPYMGLSPGCIQLANYKLTETLMSQNDGGDNYSYDSERQRLLDEFAAALKARHKNPGSEPWFS